MTIRCLKFFVRGLLWLRPVPYHGDFVCWANGQALSIATAAVGALAGIVIGLAVILCIATSPAHAAYGTPQERAVCLPDFKRLCPSLTDNSPALRLLACIYFNRKHFGRPCSAVLERHGL